MNVHCIQILVGKAHLDEASRKMCCGRRGNSLEQKTLLLFLLFKSVETTSINDEFWVLDKVLVIDYLELN